MCPASYKNFLNPLQTAATDMGVIFYYRFTDKGNRHTIGENRSDHSYPVRVDDERFVLTPTLCAIHACAKSKGVDNLCISVPVDFYFDRSGAVNIHGRSMK